MCAEDSWHKAWFLSLYFGLKLELEQYRKCGLKGRITGQKGAVPRATTGLGGAPCLPMWRMR